MSFVGNPLVRFVIIGTSSAACYFVITLAFQTVLGIAPWAACGLAYAITFGGTYLLQRGWTFRSSAAHKVALPRYAATQFVSLLLTMTAVRFCSAVFQTMLPVAISLCATIFAASVSYILSSKWAFTDAAQNPE